MTNRQQLLTTLHKEMRSCRRCVEAGHEVSLGAVFSRGQPSAGPQVMLIGQAPGVTEVTAKRPFNAGSGRRLFQWLGQAGWQEDDFRGRHYMTAVTKCYPGPSPSGKGDRVPSKAEQKLCRPFLEQEMALINPCLIILVGGLAIKLMYPTRTKLTEVIGTTAYFPPETIAANPINFDLNQARQLSAFDETLPKNGRWLVPLPHPSGASLWPNKPANKALISQAINILSQIRLKWHL